MRKVLVWLFTLLAWPVLASHNKAGEITYRLISGLTYEITLVTYTENGNPQSIQADRPVVKINWGDGSEPEDVKRLSQINLPNTTWKNIYVARHT